MKTTKFAPRRFRTRARQAVLDPAEYAGPLARRPYDLRHASVSTWLSAGVSPADIAAQAGHSVHGMLKVYSQQVAGQQRRNQALIDRLWTTTREPGDSSRDSARANWDTNRTQAAAWSRIR